MSFKCLICNKDFKFESKLKEHKNRKTTCKKEKIDLQCSSCNVKFNCLAEKVRHEKTNKHIKNITINGNNNHIGDNITNNNYNNIINLTLNVNAFKNTDTTCFGEGYINILSDSIYPKIIDKNISNVEKTNILFDEVIYILEKLHFNISFEENHNLKILLIFPGIKKTVFEYLILEINAETKEMHWNALTYEELIINILDNLLVLNNRCETDNFINFINFLKKHLIDIPEDAEILNPLITKKLSEMYINFNKKQKKPERDIKSEFNDKIREYLNYRNEECKLSNGYNPEIINSEFQ